MPGTIYNNLADIAADQYGFVTTADARNSGIDPHRLLEMAKRGQLDRCGTGVYRVPLIPATSLDSYMLATLWPRKASAVISHDSALDLYGLSDVNPAKIHITVPRDHRPRRQIPQQYEIHREDLAPEEITSREGIPVVTPSKAIRQAHTAHLGLELLHQAIEDGQEQGLLNRQEAKELKATLKRPPGAARR
jgi:predicted transcriptional regulator of viral defense system